MDIKKFFNHKSKIDNHKSYRFPKFTTESVLDVVAKMWDLSGSVPLPKFQPHCAVCGHDQILCKHWKYFIHKSGGSSHPYRCDIWLKCTSCSYVWTHGIVVPEEMHPKKRQVFYWRDVKDELEKKQKL